MEDLNRIKKWLARRETENPIPAKSRDRVLDSMARRVRATKAPPKGVCHTCGDHVERILPITMKVCRGCVDMFIKRSGRLKVLARTHESYYCDNCYGKTFTTYTINPFICQRCARRLGNRHRTMGAEYVKMKERDLRTRDKRMGR